MKNQTTWDVFAALKAPQIENNRILGFPLNDAPFGDYHSGINILSLFSVPPIVHHILTILFQCIII